jgi:hypothetical protein
MRALHFAALVHERAALSVQVQAHEALRPFVSYVGAAIDAAKARQVRYRVRWQPVPDLQRIRLRALDTVVDPQPGLARYRVEGWPPGVAPDPVMPLMVVNRSVSVAVVALESSPEGPLVSVAQPLQAEDQVFWGGKPCRLAAVSASALSMRLFDAALRPLSVRESRAGGESPRLIVQGRVEEFFDETGQPLSFQPLDPFTDLTRLEDARGEPLPWSGQGELEVSQLPAPGPVRGNNGVRFEWESLRDRERGRPGTWIQLLTPEVEGEASVDPRAAFCEEGVSEVRVEGGREAFRVRGFQRDSYRLRLERLPPEGSVLQLPVDLRNLRRQMDALGALRHAPLPHHRGLVRLLEDPAKTSWAPITPAAISRWHVLQDEHSSGTLQQREFVARALATPDLAFLEGPPGSGKTHAICELILQLLERRQRVLLCSSTHVAVDNVLERLVGRFPQVEAVRIGKADRVDPRVRERQLDTCIAHLMARWRGLPSFDSLDEEALERMAQGVVLDSANLTCGTTLGILAHPTLRDEERSRSKHPRFDVLILDETSKTTFQEMLVPALFARRWILVGDARQLPPFTERADLEAALRDLTPGEHRSQAFAPAHQRACLLLHRLARPALQGRRLRWLVTEEAEVLKHLARELVHRRGEGHTGGMEAVRIIAGTPAPPSQAYAEVSLTELERGTPAALRVLSAPWVLIEPELLDRAERWLASGLCWTREDLRRRRALASYRSEHWRGRWGTLPEPVRDRGESLATVGAVEAHEATFLRERDWASEVGWRLVRVHELGAARARGEREKRLREREELLPRVAPEGTWVKEAVSAVQDIGLRSALEVLQRGASPHRARRPSAMSAGLPREVWASRAVLLCHQHRMHPDISAFPRKAFYEQRALLDANTLTGREERVGWSYGRELAGRRLWSHVRGSERGGVNAQEVEVMRQHLEAFLAWAKAHPRREGRWEVACLAFYVRQELAIRDMLRAVTGQPRQETRFELPGVTLSSGTVDRFQGREADLVLLSLRNTQRVGFLDSPHRLNVALTRARHLLLVVGRRDYFGSCGVEELELLARETAVLAPLGRAGRGS